MNPDFLTRLSLTPDVCLQKIDLTREAGLLVQFDEQSYRAASFLDDRILTPATKGAWAPLAGIAEHAGKVRERRPVHFIFHSGHVGSTLLSRLLDETGVVLSLREPLPLRTLAEAHDLLGTVESLLSEAQFASLASSVIGVWSRGYAATRKVIVKATSTASRVACPLLRVAAQSRAVCLNVTAEVYLATLLAGRNSSIDLRGHGAVRIALLQKRLQTRLGPLYALSLGELAAMSWLAETLNQREMIACGLDRVMPIDFDELLANLQQGLQRVLAHFELPASAETVSAIARSPVLSRYSKASEFEYSPQIRSQILSEARRNHSQEIGKGLHWLESLAKTEPAVAEVLNPTAA